MRLNERSQTINSAQRITGNGLICIVDALLGAKRDGLEREDVHSIIHTVLRSQCLVPGRSYYRKRVVFKDKNKAKLLMYRIDSIISAFEEDI